MSVSKVKHKLKQVKYRHLQKELKASYKLDPICCPNCQQYFRIRTKEIIKKEFNDFMETASRAEIAVKYPDVAALLWVLETFNSEVSDTSLDFEYMDLAGQNQQLLKIVEDMKRNHHIKMSDLEKEKEGLSSVIVEERNQFFSEKDNWESERLQLSKEISSLRELLDQKDKSLSVEINKSLWQRFVGIFR